MVQESDPRDRLVKDLQVFSWEKTGKSFQGKHPAHFSGPRVALKGRIGAFAGSWSAAQPPAPQGCIVLRGAAAGLLCARGRPCPPARGPAGLLPDLSPSPPPHNHADGSLRPPTRRLPRAPRRGAGRAGRPSAPRRTAAPEDAPSAVSEPAFPLDVKLLRSFTGRSMKAESSVDTDIAHGPSGPHLPAIPSSALPGLHDSISSKHLWLGGL
ncbi:potassium/sodium hyperpolarization-activated cyclic nucleotide-gated channel 4-like [Muntiacus reevesi]|uniref:potassium/sodium hyperpolarization-activated cyclic nucleotide-gated channel 4-like n=1 Tax=Muntiacus reevesi TaxID=9886 RepID=UPI0033078F5B